MKLSGRAGLAALPGATYAGGSGECGWHPKNRLERKETMARFHEVDIRDEERRSVLILGELPAACRASNHQGHRGCSPNWPAARRKVEAAGGRVIAGPRLVGGEWWALIEFPNEDTLRTAGVLLYPVRWDLWAI